MKPLYVYRIRKMRGNRVARGVGRQLAIHFDPEGGGTRNVLTSVRPAHAIPEDTVVWNYGRSVIPEWIDNLYLHGGRILNHPDSVKISADKRKSLNFMSDMNVPCLTYTTDKQDAQGWLENGDSVIVRHIVNGKRGRGIELVRPGDELPDAPLYTKFYDKTHEFRVHVVGGQVVDYVQKKKLGKKKREERGIAEVDMISRNHNKGWVFAHNNIYDKPEIRKIGVDAIAAIGLDIGAVDVLAKINEDGTLKSAVVCETNSSPGMSSSVTFNAYVNAVKEKYLVNE